MTSSALSFFHTEHCRSGLVRAEPAIVEQFLPRGGERIFGRLVRARRGTICSINPRAIGNDGYAIFMLAALTIGHRLSISAFLRGRQRFGRWLVARRNHLTQPGELPGALSDRHVRPRTAALSLALTSGGAPFGRGRTRYQCKGRDSRLRPPSGYLARWASGCWRPPHRPSLCPPSPAAAHGQMIEQHIDPPGDQVLQRRSGAAMGHVLKFQAREMLKMHARDIRGASDSDGLKSISGAFRRQEAKARVDLRLASRN